MENNILSEVSACDAWNQYYCMVQESIASINFMHTLAKEFENHPDPFMKIAAHRLNETALYYYMDGMIFERDNYITMIADDMEKNGDDWIFYMASRLQDKHVFEWLKQRDVIIQFMHDTLKENIKHVEDTLKNDKEIEDEHLKNRLRQYVTIQALLPINRKI